MINLRLQGKVQKGHSRGKQLGFPTINFPITEKIAEGIYISQTMIGEKKYNSLTFIGAAQTFDQTDVNAETYIFDFNQDIYGQSVEVWLLKKIRDNEKFESEEKLIEQMEEDKKVAEKWFKNNK
ncbi:riboflavin kinase [Candidatus Roizmanbacteria bacterium]|nr:riboflavin kinase [Candidatus Roizmanbacteria bacterium]